MGEEPTEQYYVRRREFLNLDPDLPAFIIGVVEDTRHIPDDDPNRGWEGGQITLVLADCYRRVSFDFNMWDEAERANSLRKITLIAEIVNAVQRGMTLEVASRNARPAAVEPAAAVEPVKPVTTDCDRLAPFFSSQVTRLGL